MPAERIFDKMLAGYRVVPHLVSRQHTRHVVAVTEGLTTGRALSGAVLDQIRNAALAKNVAAKLQYRIPNVGIADRADGKVLIRVSKGAVTVFRLLCCS